MENKNSPNQITDEEKRRALLVEYQACQDDNNSSSLSFWTLTGIFIGLSSALLGGLIYGALSSDMLLEALLELKQGEELLMLGIISYVLSIAVIIILYFLRGWLKRASFLQQCNFKRMREIEFRLGMRKGWLVDTIDRKYECENWEKVWKEELEKYSEDDTKKQELKKELRKFISKHRDLLDKYERPSGKWHHKWIFGTLFTLWGLTLISGLFLLFKSSCYIAFGVLLVLLIITCITLFTFYKRHKRRKCEAF